MPAASVRSADGGVVLKEVRTSGSSLRGTSASDLSNATEKVDPDAMVRSEHPQSSATSRVCAVAARRPVDTAVSKECCVATFVRTGGRHTAQAALAANLAMPHARPREKPLASPRPSASPATRHSHESKDAEDGQRREGPSAESDTYRVCWPSYWSCLNMASEVGHPGTCDTDVHTFPARPRTRRPHETRATVP